MGISGLRFVTWNVRGAGSREKRLKIHDRLKDLQAEVVLLQETHLANTASDVLSTAHFPHVFAAGYNTRQRGVAILINRKVTFTINSTTVDPEGRFVIVSILIQNMKLCIANIYCPNVDDPSFFHSFFTSLSDHSDSTLLIGGDLNLVLDPTMDRLSNTGTQRNWQSTKIIKQYMKDFGLCDAWRSHHPSIKDYTFFSPAHQSYSRLDYFLVSSTLLKDIPEARIYPITVSDHAPVCISLTNKQIKLPSRNWRLNISLLKDPEFINFFRS